MLLKRAEQGCVFTLLKHVRGKELPPVWPVAWVGLPNSLGTVGSHALSEGTPGRTGARCSSVEARRVEVHHRLLRCPDARCGGIWGAIKGRQHASRRPRVALGE